MEVQFKNQKGFLSNVNVRAELHGAEKEAAADLKLSIKVSNTRLSMFDAGLLHVLYHFDKEAEHDLADQGGDYLPDRKLDGLEMPLKWTGEMIGGDLTIHHGIGGKSDLKFKNIKVNKFDIDAQPGGTVTITFRVQVNPDEKAMGKLGMMVQQECEFSIDPPATSD